MTDAARADLVATPQELAGCAAALAMIVPALAGFAPSERGVVAMLPVVDINRSLMDAAPAFAEAMRARAGAACAGVFAADPFLVFDDLVVALRAGGFAAVCNFPSVGLLDGPSAAGLAAVGYDLSAELKLLARLEGEGFAVHACVAHAEAARQARAAGFTRLLFHAAFRGPAEARAALAAVTAAAAGLTIHAADMPDEAASC